MGHTPNSLRDEASAATREERDSLGTVPVAADRYWGAQTERARGNFAIGDSRMPLPIIHAIATIKKAAALSNCRLGVLDRERCNWIVAAADEVIAGRLDDHFPLSVWQSGSGTQTNMNLNEVIANRACELAGGERGTKVPVHPNDHVNRSQSTNDVFPAAIHLAVEPLLRCELLAELERLISTMERKAASWAQVVKIGRTHLMDAVPLTCGQEVGGWAAQLRAASARLQVNLDELHQLPLGGTAVGTALGTPPGYSDAVCSLLRDWTGQPWRQADNLFAVMGSHDGLVDLMDRVRMLAIALHKQVNDIRLLGCGPRAGYGELALPANEPGSSIMPGKVNPTQCEAVAMATVQVMGDAGAMAMAGAGGHLQMNVYKPLLGLTLIRSITLMRDCCRSLRDNLLEHLELNRERVAELRDRSLMLVTALVPEIGYDAASRVALHAHEQQLSLREAALALEAISPDRFDAVVDPMRMAHPHQSAE
ncbi:class II fumarate hydratase [Synechococcus sp. RSCCF101]|uniref:class II fumarate hydratase n=1 Tax=Synechococcus sp. RSCCF101 TaxID=2511069 RepID=UPI001244188E|nr:class II fumarate hydratase [Synechococcus sp. RSCCF101]QEY33106.1 class II fumarate hydratase [Synechococcus sp. RSCCF101]